MALHEARHLRRPRATDGQRYSAAAMNEEDASNRMASCGGGGGVERSSSRRAHRVQADVDLNANVFKPIAAGDVNASESMMTASLSEATASLHRGLPVSVQVPERHRERERSCGPRATADRCERDSSRRRRERSEEPVYAEFPQGTLSRGYGYGSSHCSDNSAPLSQQQQQYLYHMYARPESFLGSTLPPPTTASATATSVAVACTSNAPNKTLPSLTSFIPYPANANQLGQLSFSPAGAPAGQLTLVNPSAAAAQFGYPAVPLYSLGVGVGTQRALQLDPALLTAANFNPLAAGVPMVMPNVQGTYAGLGGNSIFPYAYTMCAPADANPNAPAPALTRAQDEPAVGNNALALLQMKPAVMSQQSAFTQQADGRASRALVPREGAFSPVGSSTMGKRAKSSGAAVRRRPSELGMMAGAGLRAIQQVDGIAAITSSMPLPSACATVSTAGGGALVAAVEPTAIPVPQQQGAAAIAAVASGELQAPSTPSSTRATSGHTRLYSVVKGSFV